jgi:hypothetical protein
LIRLGKIRSFIHTLFSHIPRNDKAKALYQWFSCEASSLSKESSMPVFAVQGVEDPLYYGLFGMITIDVRRRIKSEGRLVVTRSFSSYIGNGFRALIMRSDLLNWVISSQWARINRQVVGTVGYRSNSFNYPCQDVCDFWRAYKLWRSLENSTDISELVINDILVGDLIIDSFLRFQPSPYFIVKDRFALTLIWQVYRDTRRAYNYFSECKPSFYLSSYSTYIPHGVAVRIALKLNVPVYVVSSGLAFGKKLSEDDYFHTADASYYCSIFEKADRQAEKLRIAEEQLRFRLSGGIDAATVYMKRSAYSHSDEKLPDVKGAVVIFLHDFYDSPHVYNDFIFPDFWSWICFTIDALYNSGTSFWVKPHPNQIPLSDDAFLLLLQKYPELNVISSRITNSQLVGSGIVCGVTAYGTVAHELAYMGIPSICCAKHPHHSFGFCRTARKLDEYQCFLQTPDTLPLPANEMQRQALAFYYMHNIYGGEENLALRRQFNAWFREVHDDEGTQLVETLANFRELSGYNKFIDELVEDVRIG